MRHAEQHAAYTNLQPYADPRYWGWDGQQPLDEWTAMPPTEQPPADRVARKAGQQSLRGYLETMHTYFPSGKVRTGEEFSAAELPLGTIVLCAVEQIDYGNRAPGRFAGEHGSPRAERSIAISPTLGRDQSARQNAYWRGVAYSRDVRWGVVSETRQHQRTFLTLPSLFVAKTGQQVYLSGPISNHWPEQFTVGQTFRTNEKRRNMQRVNAVDICGTAPPKVRRRLWHLGNAFGRLAAAAAGQS
jgi:hypothetical protein